MLQLWTVSKLNKLPLDLRRKVKFYAPLLYSLDCVGIDPATFTRAGTSTATYRDGASHTVAANIPRFEYSGNNPVGILLSSGETLQFAPANGLNDSNTLIWFEEAVPKSTPTNGNPFNSSGVWTGNLNIHVTHVLKAYQALSAREVQLAQTILGQVAQDLTPIVEPPITGVGTFFDEAPAGTKNGVNKVFTLSLDPNVESLIVTWGGLFMHRVASAPAEMQYTVGGTGNRTITLGSAPQSTEDVTAHGVIA